MLGKPSRRAQERLAQHGRRATATVLKISGQASLTVGNPGITTNTVLIRKVRLRVEPEDEDRKSVV